jgi:PiT family inorganic phosphate transporter
MAELIPGIILITVLVAVLFDISNGWNDSANAIATVVSTRVLSPAKAVFMAATMNMLGAFFTTAVAKTIGKGIVNPQELQGAPLVIIAALIAGFIWNTAMTRFGMPVSASHALIGSLIGAAFSYKGMAILNLAGLRKIFLALLISPVLGVFVGYVFMKIILKLFGRHSPGALNKNFGILQLFSSAFMAFSHGSNDAQKVMGVITLSLFSGGFISTMDVPLWVIALCGSAMGLGTALGGWKVIKTIGLKMLKLEPVHGFAAETAATAIIVGASHLGLPVSTTHVISTSIMGVGATRRLSAVRWGIAGKILMAWVFTLPFCALLAWFFFKILSQII